jgi:DNA primase
VIATDTGTNLDVLREINAAATQILTSPPRRAAAVAYLRHRGIDASVLPAHWPLGYAPPGWTRLVDQLRQTFTEQDLIDAGVAQRSSRGSLIDRFRERVIFPICHTDGYVAGFIGRDLSGHPETPKYLNTPHTVLFLKGELLYGFHEGLTGNPEPAQFILAEGPVDVLALAASASKCGRRDVLPVAASGTAFTDHHAWRLTHLSQTRTVPVVVAFDGDAPGRAAALVAGERLRAVGLDVRVAALPNGLDPADALAQPDSSIDQFTHANAVPLLTLQVERFIAAQGDRMQWIEGRLQAARNIAGYLTSYPVSHTAAQIGWIAHALHIDGASFTDELVTAYRHHGGRGAPSACRGVPRDTVLRPPAVDAHQLTRSI